MQLKMLCQELKKYQTFLFILSLGEGLSWTLFYSQVFILRDIHKNYRFVYFKFQEYILFMYILNLVIECVYRKYKMQPISIWYMSQK